MIDRLDLSGSWELRLSEKKEKKPTRYEDEICLPDTLSHARKCPPCEEKLLGSLTDTYRWEGHMWVRREFETDRDYSGGTAELFLERTRITEVYIDGKKIGTQNSLCTPHRYDITEHMTAGKHEIAICVSNVGYPTGGGHLTSADTQTNWLGITGRIEIRFYPKTYIHDVLIEADVPSQTVTVNGFVAGKDAGRVEISAVNRTNGRYIGKCVYGFSGGRFSAMYNVPLRDNLWSEDEQNILEMKIECADDVYTTVFGMVQFSSDGRKLLVNGEETFLRGKHDGMLFPLTGYAPTDKDAWLERLSVAKAYGINHYRFHTCCPPEAAFEAADELGIYMEPELPFWGTITTPADENHNENEQRFLIEEGFRIIKEYGNHPSFRMMSLGNELWGNQEKLNEILAQYKKLHPSIFYTSGSNNFQFVPAVLEEEQFLCGVRFSRERLYRGSYAMCDAPQGHIQTQAPNFSHNYDEIISASASDCVSKGGEIEIQYGTGVKKVRAETAGGELICNIPVISHEVGQYSFFPDFDEEKKYTGSSKPFYLHTWRENMEKSGIYGQRRQFFNSTGKLAADCYKAEIETAMRSGELSGFQLLDLQDFNGQGVALVGILDAFMDSKNIISIEKWREFCSQSVILAELPKLVYCADELLAFDVIISSCGRDKITDGTVVCTLDINGSERKLEFDFRCDGGRVTRAGQVSMSLSDISRPTRATLTLEIRKQNVCNEYTIWIFPEISVEITDRHIVANNKLAEIARSREAAEKLLAEGKKVILVPEESENTIQNTYCTDFWNYPMFRSISESMNRPVPVGTLGMLVDTSSRYLSSFPCENYSTPQWFEIAMHSHCDIIDGTDITPAVQPIDNTERCHKLGLLYELETKSGKLLVCTSRLWEIADKIEVKHFAASIIKEL